MTTPVQFNVILPEEYTPLATHESAMSTMGSRLSEVEKALANNDNTSPADPTDLADRVAELERQLAALKTSAASDADVKALTKRTDTNEASIAHVIAQLASFSFETGDVAALRERNSLPERQLFIVVDTKENLEKLAAEQAEDGMMMSFAFGGPASVGGA